MTRMTRDRRLTAVEAANAERIRSQIAGELPELIARHHERTSAQDAVHDLLDQLKTAREAKGLSLAELSELTGLDRSALSKLEAGQGVNTPIETLVRYADAVGQKLTVTLAEG